VHNAAKLNGTPFLCSTPLWRILVITTSSGPLRRGGVIRGSAPEPMSFQANKQVESCFPYHNSSIHLCSTDSLLMTHRGGLSLSIIIWKIGGGGQASSCPRDLHVIPFGCYNMNWENNIKWTLYDILYWRVAIVSYFIYYCAIVMRQWCRIVLKYTWYHHEISLLRWMLDRKNQTDKQTIFIHSIILGKQQ
jgi:hypothetical protein